MKGFIVCDIIVRYRFVVVFELGGYIGYLVIMFGYVMRQVGGKQYYSVEKSFFFVVVVISLIDFVGFRDYVRVVVGMGVEGIWCLYEEGKIFCVDMVFFDYFKLVYIDDFKLCEWFGVVGLGILIVVDNMVLLGNLCYFEWVYVSVERKCEMDKGVVEKGNLNLQYCN